MIRITHKGNFTKTYNFLNRITGTGLYRNLHKYGHDGVKALSDATPIKSGKTASSWYYKIETNKTGISIIWCNKNLNQNVPIAVIIQYGHAVPQGGFVRGVDYINPTLKPIFDDIANSIWREVQSS